jgi:PAS domain S-box-containing protein
MMSTVSGYQIAEVLCATAGSSIYRARELKTGKQVLLKLFDADKSGLVQRARCKHEYGILCSLDLPGIRPIALIDEPACPAIVLPDFAGESLQAALDRQQLKLHECLSIAGQLAGILDTVHAARIIHGDLRPANILISRDGRVCLVDFSLATYEAQEVLAGITGLSDRDWAYLSPEQTGRVNRVVDCRTDFYSLGVTLYRLFTGQLPFEASDPIEWAHCHIARLARRPQEVAPALPVAVSDIIMKLLAKVAEERYQTAYGLQSDLARCLAEWQSSGQVAPFTLRTKDISSRFRIPQKLYGRQSEAAAMLKAFEQMTATGQASLVLVSGESGVGKSTLVQELHRPVARERGYFIAGKFAPYQRDIPYAAMVDACRMLVQQMLAEPEAGMDAWRRQIQAGLDGYGQLLIDLMPQLKLVIGPQPPLPEISPPEMQHQFQRVFRHFLGLLAAHRRPLVLFLDDAQWADAASLNLFEHLLTHPDTRYLMLVAGYRDIEVGPGHPLLATRERMRKAVNTAEVHLEPLGADDLCQLLSETLRCSVTDAQPLAGIILRKTNGNAFFINQFLRTLHRDGMIAFGPGQGWSWDMQRIEDAQVTANVVDWMSSQISRLAPDVNRMLRLAACLGHQFEPDILARVATRSSVEVGRQLDTAVQQGFLLAAREASEETPPGRPRIYRWSHDRVQQAAYSLIESEERPAIHLCVGRALLAAGTERRTAAEVFEIVRHLNLAAALVTDPSEREQLVQLNLAAARHAKRATAYAAARNYASLGVGLLPSPAWQEHYALSLALHHELVEAHYLCNDGQQAEALLDEVLARPHPDRERADLLRLRILYAMSQKIDYARALQVGLEALRLLGVDLPTDRQGWDVAADAAFAQVDQALKRVRIEDLPNLPLMTDPTKLAIAELLIELFGVARLREPQLWNLLVLEHMQLTLQHGRTHGTAYGFATFGVLLYLRGGDIDEGYRFGRLARQLLRRFPQPDVESRADITLGSFLEFWREPLAAILPRYMKAVTGEIEHGNAQYGGYSLVILVARELACGLPLSRIAEDSSKAVAFAERSANDISLYPLKGYDRLVAALRGQPGASTELATAPATEPETTGIDAVLEQLESRAGDSVKYEHLAELKRCVLLGEFDNALRLTRRAGAASMTAGPIFYPMVEISFYQALTLAATCDIQDASARDETFALLRLEEERFAKWARGCPPNFACFQMIIAAELARLTGDHPLALYRYEQAIAAAALYRLPNMQGLAAERAAAACAARGARGHAADYLQVARAAYGAWEADGKVRQIDANAARHRDTPGLPAPEQLDEQLDVLSVSKASQAISGEIVLEKLLDTLMRVMIESAGAQKGCLVLFGADGPYLAAEAQVEAQHVTVRRPHETNVSASSLPESVLNYVRHSNEPVLLIDATEANSFSGDPYLQAHRPKSLLCLPILRQRELTGLLYLEHKLVTHVFTADRLAVLRLLASQAAISLENARLYTELKESESRIRRLVDSNIIGIFFWSIDGCVTEANEAFLRMTGYTREDVQSKQLRRFDLTPPEYSAIEERAIDELRRTGTCTPYEKEYIRKDGSRVPILIGSAFIHGSRESGIAFVLDLTERKQAEAERAARKVAEEANAANAAKSTFLANMSHELRSPLNAILGFARIVERRPELPPDIKEDLGIVLRSGDHLRMLINQVLDLARSQTGRSVLNETSFDLHSLLHELEDMFALKAEDKGLMLEVQFDDVPHFVRTDLLKLRQVLINLLGNAVKFTRQGRIALRISRRTTAAGMRLCFAVADTGVGIEPEELGNLFNPFTQADAGRQAQEGTGLGLSISRSYVRLMGGDIHIESVPGRDTTVSFAIPLQLAAMETTPVSPSGPSRRVVALAAGQPQLRVLVVDDRLDARQLLVRLLTPLGFKVQEAVNGQQAVEIWEAWRPHLIWMDIRMPVMDGCTATRLIKAKPEGQATVIIALSASSFEEERADFLAAGCDDFLRKPLQEEELFGLMQKHLGLRFLYEEESPATPGPLAQVQADALTTLPDELRRSLEQALIRLDTDGVASAIAQVSDKPMAHALEKMAHDFHYGEMLQLLQNANGKAAT